MNEQNILKISLVTILIFSNLLFAENYYSDPVNGSMRNNGSFKAPFSSLEKVIEKDILQPGDTLFLMNGFHGKMVKLINKNSVPIVITAFREHEPKILQMEISGSGWIVNGLTFIAEGNYKNGTPRYFDNGLFLKLTQTSSENVIKNCNFFSIKNSDKWKLNDWRKKVWSGVRDFGKKNILDKNHFRNIAYAIELDEVCKHSIIRNNVIENFSGDGIRIGGADFCTIQFNIIKNSIELDSNTFVGNHEDGIQAWVGKENDTEVKNLIVEGNLILNNTSLNKKFRGYLQGIGFFDGPYVDCVIENNVVIVEHFHGISLFAAYNCKIINNTVLPQPETFPYVYGPPWIGIFPHKNGKPSAGNIVRNNLATNMILEEGSTVADHNLIDPVAFKFVKNYKKFDFTPKPEFVYGGHFIIDNGSSECAPAFDFAGNKRPQGKGFDIGAYEFYPE